MQASTVTDALSLQLQTCEPSLYLFLDAFQSTLKTILYVLSRSHVVVNAVECYERTISNKSGL